MDSNSGFAIDSEQIEQLSQLAKFCWQRGWSPAGSCSFSLVLDRKPFRMLTTVGNRSRADLQASDFTIVDQDGRSVDSSSSALSSETALHVWIAKQHPCQWIIQTHSVWSALLVDRFGPLDGVLLEEYELLQRLPNVSSASHAEWLPIVINYEKSLVAALERSGKDKPSEVSQPSRAMVVQHHGLLTWADSANDAQNQLELFEYFCEYLIRRSSFG